MLPSTPSPPVSCSRRKRFTSSTISRTTMSPSRIAQPASSSNWTTSARAIPRIISTGKVTHVSQTTNCFLKRDQRLTGEIQVLHDFSTCIRWRSRKDTRLKPSDTTPLATCIFFWVPSRRGGVHWMYSWRDATRTAWGRVGV